ncbi:MAG: hypothetical protein WCO19_05235, partial [Candidatus Saccharibacteria bacterium]
MMHEIKSFDQLVDHIYHRLLAADTHASVYSSLSSKDFSYLNVSDDEVEVSLRLGASFSSGEAVGRLFLASTIGTFLATSSFPKNWRQKAMSVANYYGDTLLVRSIANGGDLEFEEKLLVAKSLKSDGDSSLAESIYKDCINWAALSGDNYLQAYGLLMYAKLCDHAPVRYGWHRALHSIAYNRFLVLSQSDDLFQSSKQRRWMQISADSEAVLRHRYDSAPSSEVDLLFEKALRLCDNEDSRKRINASRAVVQIQRACSGNFGYNHNTANIALEELQESVRWADENGNERASYVRLGWFLREARRVKCRRLESSKTSDTSWSFDSIVDSAEEIANKLVSVATRFSDPEHAAAAVIEAAEWRKIRLSIAGTMHPRECERLLPLYQQGLEILGDHPERYPNYYSELLRGSASQPRTLLKSMKNLSRNRNQANG